MGRSELVAAVVFEDVVLALAPALDYLPPLLDLAEALEAVAAVQQVVPHLIEVPPAHCHLRGQ